MLRISAGYCSLAGKRERNEDFVGMVTPAAKDLLAKGMLIAVADGVSGNGGGREASEYTVRGLLSDYYATPDTWDVPVAIDRVANAINRWLLAQSSARPELEGMATTLTALVLRRRRYWFAHIGDTRAYLLRQGELTRLTTDHVWDRPDMRHVLTRAIGLDAKLAIDYGDGELEEGDVFVLATDGVWEPLRDSMIAAVTRAGADPEHSAQALCEAALAKGSQDNLSAAVVRVDALPAIDPRDAAQALNSLPALPHLKPGAAIDGFHVLEVLHRSRATLLYKVRDDASGGIFVLKTLDPLVADDPDERAAFGHEEWLARRLNARYFAQYIPLPPVRRAHLYYVMSWHDGATLQQLLAADRHFSVPDVVRLGTQLVRGVGALHRRSILHRDLKPANIHIGDDGELRILDLGIAQSEDQRGPLPAMLAGTPTFLAPEHYTGARASRQSDLYAVGITLYHLLTRKYPYGEIEPFQRPRFGEAVPPSRYRPDTPRWFENALLKAVAREPAQRFETAEEFMLALERGAARPVSPPPPLPLVDRDPVAFWRAIAIIVAVINVLLLYWLLAR